MKKVLTLIVMAVAFAMPSQAQIKFGVMGGLNLTNMSFNKDAVENAVKNKAGFFIGPTVKFTLPVVGLGIDGALLYDQREAKVDAGEGGSQTIKSQSIQIPINVRYGFGIGSVAEIFAFAGPQFGFNIGSKNKTLSEWKEATAEYKSEWTMNNSNLSANVGIGATILGHLQAKVNYNIALGKTGEVEVKDAANTALETAIGKAKANAWQVSAAYYF
jgi:hypothetical protein